MHSINHETLQAAIAKLGDHATPTEHIPASIMRHLGECLVVEGHDEDQKWQKTALERTYAYLGQKRTEAKEGGYSPFIFMGKEAYDWIQQNCAAWVLGAMETSFRDAEDIHPEWAVQCAKTMSLLGKDRCTGVEDLYTFLVEHPEWSKQTQARDNFRQEQNRRHEADRPEKKDAPSAKPRLAKPQGEGIPGQLELVLKISELPEHDNYAFFVKTRDHTLRVALEPSSFERILDAHGKWASWEATLRGPLSRNTRDGLRLDSPMVQVYEVSH